MRKKRGMTIVLTVSALLSHPPFVPKGGETVFNKENSTTLRWLLPVILSAVMIAVCGSLFIYHYRGAYDTNTNGGFFSPRDGVIFYHILVVLAAIPISVIAKLIWKRKLSLLVLLAISVCLPILCYQINYHTLKKDGMLYFLVQEGGALHFVTLHDFDRDGVNDAYDYTGDDVREISGNTLGETDPHGVIERMEYTIVGKGGKLPYAGCELHWAANEIGIRLNKSRVTYEEIRITLYLTEAVDVDRFILYQGGSRLAFTRVDEHTISMTIGADTCALWQQNALEESFRMSVRYEVED